MKYQCGRSSRRPRVYYEDSYYDSGHLIQQRQPLMLSER
jgi:hypothetical protein